jgi:hypothetical protein
MLHFSILVNCKTISGNTRNKGSFHKVWGDEDYIVSATATDFFVEAPTGYWKRWRSWSFRRRTYRNHLANQHIIAPTIIQWQWHWFDYGICPFAVVGGA